MPPSRNRVHLDTHVVCWLYAGLVHQLSQRVVECIETNQLVISPWVLAELQVLYEKGVLTLPALPIFEDLEKRLGLSITNFTSIQVIKASMSLSWAEDPFDRMIVSEASLDEAPLITKDAHLHAHFKQVIW